MFDILIFVTILYFMWKGYQRGFARELPRIGALVAALIVGIIFYSVIAVVLNSTPLPDWIGGFTANEFFERAASIESKEGTVNQVFGAINSVKDKRHMIGEFVVMYISLIIVFFIAYFLLRGFSKKKKLYRKIKIPMQLNPALGGCVGVIRGILIIYIVCAFLVICEPLIPSDFIIEQVDKSELMKALYDKNYIANIVARQDFLSGGI